MFKSVKVIDGFSTCFRQWKAEDTHCKFLHGYGIYFKVTFQGDLDFRNWVMDFGFMKRGKERIEVQQYDQPPVMMSVDEWFKFMFDHTTVISKDDPEFNFFEQLHHNGALQLRVLDKVGCEMFAKKVLDTLNEYVLRETDGRVQVIEVECCEHSKNSAIYSKPFDPLK